MRPHTRTIAPMSRFVFRVRSRRVEGRSGIAETPGNHGQTGNRGPPLGARFAVPTAVVLTVTVTFVELLPVIVADPGFAVQVPFAGAPRQSKVTEP